MRQKLLALLFSALMLFSGAAMAQPPDDDPTCGRGQQSGQECAGDDGDEGCEGINRAREHTEDTPAADAFDLVTDILGEGDESECEDGEG